ncbi:hypothetical protein COO60DRAFT_1211890 [Scenedesmus sp. NREL 46B-D3]|nr:hypothetical protein COO60DRAFT_1211890 [Scenedesmus sp. NREL 46B-D3]
MRWLLLPPPALLAMPRTTSGDSGGSSSSSSSGGDTWESKRGMLLAATASVLCASAAFAIYQLTKTLFAIVRDSELETDKLITAVSATIQTDSPDVVVPEELVMYDDIEDVYSYGSVQELFYRRSMGGDTDWEWSFDMDEWFSTDDLAPAHSFILDPPSLIFIARLHLTSVVRRKFAAVAGLGSNNSNNSSTNRAGGRHCPHRQQQQQ